MTSGNRILFKTDVCIIVLAIYLALKDIKKHYNKTKTNYKNRLLTTKTSAVASQVVLSDCFVVVSWFTPFL